MRRDTLDLTSAGWAIAFATAILTIFGLASVYVTDTHYIAGHDGPANAARQAVRLIIGIALAIAVLRIGYQRVAGFSYSIFALAVVLLIPLAFAKLYDTSFGGLITPRNGAYRWIQLPGFLLQPSEFMKVAFVIALAWYLRYRKNYRRLGGLVLPFAISVIPLVLILLEPDLGSALLLVPVVFMMLFVAGARVRHLVAIALIGLALTPIAWRYAHTYQRLRVTSLLLQNDDLRNAVIADPERYGAVATRRQALEWSASSGYQLVHSKNAIGSGGLFGHGWGNGIYVYTSLLPDRHNDFIFAIVAHQWGLIGCLLVLACYVVIVIAGVRIASVTTEPFARLLAVGIVTLIVTQAVISVGMSVGLMPITGMTLPFVSYGGSSVLCNFVAVALLVSVSQHRPYLLTRQPFVFGREETEQTARAHTPVSQQ